MSHEAALLARLISLMEQTGMDDAGRVLDNLQTFLAGVLREYVEVHEYLDGYCPSKVDGTELTLKQRIQHVFADVGLKP